MVHFKLQVVLIHLLVVIDHLDYVHTALSEVAIILKHASLFLCVGNGLEFALFVVERDFVGEVVSIDHELAVVSVGELKGECLLLFGRVGRRVDDDDAVLAGIEAVHVVDVVLIGVDGFAVGKGV